MRAISCVLTDSSNLDVICDAHTACPCGSLTCKRQNCAPPAHTACYGETRRMHLLRINGGRTLKNWERGFRAPEQ